MFVPLASRAAHARRSASAPCRATARSARSSVAAVSRTVPATTFAYRSSYALALLLRRAATSSSGAEVEIRHLRLARRRHERCGWGRPRARTRSPRSSLRQLLRITPFVIGQPVQLADILGDRAGEIGELQGQHVRIGHAQHQPADGLRRTPPRTSRPDRRSGCSARTCRRRSDRPRPDRPRR